jgi:hypothetical protein
MANLDVRCGWDRFTDAAFRSPSIDTLALERDPCRTPISKKDSAQLVAFKRLARSAAHRFKVVYKRGKKVILSIRPTRFLT